MACDNINSFGFNEINEVRDELNLMLKISNEIENIHCSLLVSLPHHMNLQDNLNNLNDKSSQLRSISLRIRNLLYKIKCKEKYFKGIQYEINKNQLKYLRDQYHNLLIKINENDEKYRLLSKQRLDRQLHLLGRQASNDQLNEFIIVPDIMIKNSEQEQLLYNQSKQIDHLENTLLQLKDLFNDFNYFVEYQSEIINSIDEKILQTDIKIEQQIDKLSSSTKNKSLLSFIIIRILFLIFIIIFILLIIIISRNIFIKQYSSI
ncbi:unnamed protein product [Adineta steineri]|uniref:t-SNARE coiled-coil homology domain-containing protein n=1 Tax=Adineta steineri TaxID=433720 RepID=A0A815WW28_9BILA|nr:unnamed protein product [Adineta steineri]CAF1548339.1 unnamed protein product [Adineta steineri]CAF1660176.1 unnamed protein product [Adineta steineri]CAF1660186.1 unnamed protein product [Adineta steineri]